MDVYLCGMITACNWIAATIFLRFWKQTRDRLFLFFALAFLVFGFSRLPRAFVEPDAAWTVYTYLVRFIAHASLLVAILDKNLQSAKAAETKA